MTDFQWVSIFEELSDALVPYEKRQKELIELLLSHEYYSEGINDKENGQWIPLTEIDPFTFVSIIVKFGSDKRKKIFEHLKQKMNLRSEVPDHFFGVPSSQAQNAWYFSFKEDRGPDDIQILWNLFKESLEFKITDETFLSALNVRGVGYRSLTQALFRARPQLYYPIDVQTEPFLEAHGIDCSCKESEKFSDWEKCLIEIKAEFPGKTFYELSHQAWQYNQDHKKLKRYWGGGIGDEGDLEKWIGGNYWQINFDKNTEDSAGKIAWKTFRKISIGDEFVIRGVGGPKWDDLVCHYYGEVLEKDNIKGILRLKELQRPKYKGKKPKGKGSGNWGITLNEVTREEDIDLIFQSNQGKTHMETNKLFSRNMLNIIFYGPPGTGKTYETIDRAVFIASEKKSDNHKENKIIFDQLKKEKQIGFVTFHQNYSYEDFVIGLRPDPREEGLRFYEKEGIFFEFSERARRNYEASKSGSKVTRTFEEVFDEIISPLENNEQVEIRMASGASFKITGVSERTIYFDKQSEGYKHTLCIETLKELVNEERETIIGLKSYYTPLVNMIKEKMVQQQRTNIEPRKNFVLIIDEINRANISKVFGELITLLEEDKRIDGDNAMSVMLPNGKEFSVPPNLYIIGTMNTADKSIAFIDIALRRRFEFEGIYPKYDVDGLNKDKADFLRALNKNIQAMKKSSDYLIGHAYFLNKDTIEDILKRKIIPLLMEYFSNKVDFVSDTFKGTGFAANYDEENCSWIVKRG